MEFVVYNQEKIEYELIRKNVKNINLRIYPDGRIAVSANSSVPYGVINSFVLKNAERIIKAKEKFKSFSAYETDITKLSAVKILGCDYSIQIVLSSSNCCEIKEDVLIINCIDKSKVNEIYYNYLLSLAENEFSRILAQVYPFFSKYCKRIPFLKIKLLKSQWGNCRYKENRITLNLRLIHYNRDVIKFVVMHEYCHFIEPNHSKNFYKVLELVMPDWKKYDNILKNK